MSAAGNSASTPVPGPGKTYVLGSAAIAKEKQRLDLQHRALQLLTDNKHILAPIKSEPRSLLELGTGTGIWAREYAEIHPSCTVTMTDIVNGVEENLLPNLEFRILNFMDEDWKLAEQFDLIHSRFLFTVQADWTKVLASAYVNLKPGGFLEMKEVDMRFVCEDGSWERDGSRAKELAQLWLLAIEKMGANWFMAAELAARMRAVGFLDVQEIDMRIPYGPNSADPKEREAGRLSEESIRLNPVAFTAPLKLGLGHSDEQIAEFLKQLHEVAYSGKVKMHMGYKVVIGRKPE